MSMQAPEPDSPGPGRKRRAKAGDAGAASDRLDLRRPQPPLWVERPGGPSAECILTRYADVQSFLRDPRVSADRMCATAYREWIEAAPPEARPEPSRGSMLTADPPDHRRLRGLVSSAFTPRRIERLRPRIEQIVAALLDDMAARAGNGETVDAVPALAEPLPAVVIAELLGVPPGDHPRFRRWSQELLRGLVGDRAGRPTPGASATRRRLRGYLREVISQRRRTPRDDLISALAEACDAGDALSDEELLETCTLILVAGHETTTNLIGCGLLTLLRHPEQLARLRAQPEQIGRAVEELLRWETPLQGVARVTREEVEAGGERLPPGTLVSAMLVAANRDPERFRDPERLDPAREDNPHLAFGTGIHFCLGAPLARLEAQIAFAALLDRFPVIELATEDVPRRPSELLPGLESLPLRLRERQPWSPVDCKRRR